MLWKRKSAPIFYHGAMDAYFLYGCLASLRFWKTIMCWKCNKKVIFHTFQSLSSSFWNGILNLKPFWVDGKRFLSIELSTLKLRTNYVGYLQGRLNILLRNVQVIKRQKMLFYSKSSFNHVTINKFAVVNLT